MGRDGRTASAAKHLHVQSGAACVRCHGRARGCAGGTARFPGGPGARGTPATTLIPRVHMTESTKGGPLRIARNENYAKVWELRHSSEDHCNARRRIRSASYASFIAEDPLSYFPSYERGGGKAWSARCCDSCACERPLTACDPPMPRRARTRTRTRAGKRGVRGGADDESESNDIDDDLEHSLRRCHTMALLQQVTTAAASHQYLRASVPPVAVPATLLRVA